jgi:hypothetical protein
MRARGRPQAVRGAAVPAVPEVRQAVARLPAGQVAVARVPVARVRAVQVPLPLLAQPLAWAWAMARAVRRVGAAAGLRRAAAAGRAVASRS